MKNTNYLVWSYIFILPALALFFLMTFYPVIQAALMAFYSYDPFRGGSMGNPIFVGFDNFKEVLSDVIFWKSIKNTLIYTFFVVPVTTVITLFLAYFITPLHRKWQTFFKSVFYLPSIASDAVIALIWFWIFNPMFGLLNYFLSFFGLGPIFWLGDTNWALFSIILMMSVSYWGMNVIIFTVAFDNIPNSLYEAADIDGATFTQKFFRISLPMIKPTILFILVMGTINALQIFTPMYMMTQGGPNYATTSVVYLIYETAFRNQRLGIAAAQSFILFLIIIVFTILQFKIVQTEQD